jgi:hypothetical protein
VKDYRVVFNNDTIRVFEGWPFVDSKYDVLAYDKAEQRVYDNRQESNDDIEYQIRVRATDENYENVLKIALLKLEIYLGEDSFSNQTEDDLYQQKIAYSTDSEMPLHDSWYEDDEAGVI